eukprot:6745582-Prymnesium_polylepis.1
MPLDDQQIDRAQACRRAEQHVPEQLEFEPFDVHLHRYESRASSQASEERGRGDRTDRLGSVPGGDAHILDGSPVNAAPSLTISAGVRPARSPE